MLLTSKAILFKNIPYLIYFPMLASKKILKEINDYVEKMGTPVQKIGEVIGSKAKTRQSQFSAGKNFLAGKPRAFTYERIRKISAFYDVNFITYNHNQTIKGNKNVFINSKGRGNVKVSSNDEKLVEQILSMGKSDKELIKQMISKLAKK